MTAFGRWISLWLVGGQAFGWSADTPLVGRRTRLTMRYLPVHSNHVLEHLDAYSSLEAPHDA